MNNNQVSSAPKPTIAVYMDDTPAETSQLLPEDFVQEEIRNEGMKVLQMNRSYKIHLRRSHGKSLQSLPHGKVH